MSDSPTSGCPDSAVESTAKDLWLAGEERNAHNTWEFLPDDGDIKARYRKMAHARIAMYDALISAGPDPKELQKFADETIRKRENPHDYNSIFVRASSPMSGWVICQLCGTYTLENQPVINLREHPATLHVNWHNAMHRAGVKA